MADLDIINGLIMSLGKKEYSFADLLYLTRPFSISETSIRSSLSRMVQKKFYFVRKEGKTAWYSLSAKGRKIGKNLSRGFHSPDWSSWKGEWHGALFSIPESRRKERHSLRVKLGAYRFARWYGGFWVHPAGEGDPFSGESLPQVRLIKLKPQTPIGPEEADSMWHLSAIVKDQKKAVSLLKTRSDGSRDPALALKERIDLGNRIVPLIFRDPLLPPELLPQDWLGDTLRRKFREQDALLLEESRPYWEKIFQEVE